MRFRPSASFKDVEKDLPSLMINGDPKLTSINREKDASLFLGLA